MNKFFKSTIEDYEKTKGTFVGANFPETNPEYDAHIDINFSKLPDDFTAAEHYHAQSKTWVIVTKGKMYFVLDGQRVAVGSGEFVVFEAGVREEVLKVDPGTESFTIHSPSIPGGDKVMLEKK